MNKNSEMDTDQIVWSEWELHREVARTIMFCTSLVTANSRGEYKHRWETVVFLKLRQHRTFLRVFCRQ